MILVDTSAWVEFDRATGSAVDERLAELIADDGPLAVTEPVIMEVLAGPRSDAREDELRRLLLRFDLHHFEATSDFDAAARISPMPPRRDHAARTHRLHDRHGRLASRCRAALPRRGPPPSRHRCRC